MSVTISGSTGITGNVAPYLVTGSLSANTSVIGTLSGNIAGNLVGNVTGTVTGSLSGTASTAVLATSSLSAAVAFAPAPGSQLGLQTCKAWVNFNGADTTIGTTYNAANGQTISVTAGSNIGTYNVGNGTSTVYIGQVYYIQSIGGAANATLGGVAVSNNGNTNFNPTVGFQIVSVINSSSYSIKLLAGSAVSNQTITGNGAAGGFQLFVTGIRSAYNVLSIARTATANYTVNLATTMADTNYSGSIMGSNAYAANTVAWGQIVSLSASAFSIQYQCSTGAVPTTEPSIVCVQIFGN